MKNTAVIHGISAFELATGSLSSANELLDYIAKEASARLQSEHDQIEKYFNENPDLVKQTFDREMELFSRWVQWYKECALSVGNFPIHSDQNLSDRIDIVIEGIELKSKVLREKLGKK